MRRIPALAALVVGLLAHAAAPEPAGQISPNKLTFAVESLTVRVPYYRNMPLGASHPHVERAAVIVHGNSRNAANAYDNLLAAASVAGLADSTVLLIAPQFLIEEDVAFHGLAPDILFWSDQGWKQGDASLDTVEHPRPVALSSFAVIDSILTRIAALNPNLHTLVVAGHSAGGQLVNRYAAGNPLEPFLVNLFGIDVSYVVANPSSYLYFNAERVVAGSTALFAIPPPQVQQACPGYDTYKYGLGQLNDYMSALPPGQIPLQYPTRHVTYLLGELDTDPTHPDLDTSCEAMLQGRHRLARGLVYVNHLRQVFGTSVLTTHRAEIVPGVGHSSSGMFTSPCGAALLFGAASCGPVDAPEQLGLQLLDSTRRLTNPFRVPVTLHLHAPNPGSAVTLRVYDIRGRLVRTLMRGAPGAVLWDGLSESGEPVPSGLYVFMLQQGSQAQAQKTILLR